MQGTAIWRSVRSVLALASPVILTELAGVSFNTVDILIVGRLGPDAIGAVGLGSLLFLATGALGLGMLYALDALVSQAFGARRFEECHRWLHHGLVLSLALAVLLGLVLRGLALLLPTWDLNPTLLPRVVSYLEIAAFGYVPLFLWVTLRRYLQAMSVVVPTTIAMVTSIGVTTLADLALVLGEFGAPALGTDGAAWAANVTRVYQCVFIAAMTLMEAQRRATGLLTTQFRIERAWLGRLVRLGLPAGVQFALELGVFAAASALAGRLDTASSAAHQIVFNIAAMTFVVTLAISGAGGVLVGQSVGRVDADAAQRFGWTALTLAAGFMALVAMSFLLVPTPIIGIFTGDPAIIATAAAVLMVAGSFQLFDGVQVVATGLLRGLGNTRVAMLTNFVGHWLVGLPVSYGLCFGAGLGVTGLWMGLSTGLGVVSVTLLIVWTRQARALPRWLGMAPRAA